MAASKRHRKILEYPIPNNTTTFPFCFVDCNPQLNPTGLCSPDCIPFCPSFCRPSESSPTPSPATSPHPVPPLPDHHNPPLSLPLKISLIFLITTFVYTLYKVYTVWHRSRPHRNPPPPPSPENQESDDRNILDHPIWYIRTVGLPPSVIKGLTVVNFNKIDGTTVDGTDCSVCLTEFEEDDTLRLLPNCNHAFHMPCIDTWLRSHTNCPLCRAVIVSNSVDTTSLEQNDGALEINLGISFIRDGDRGEASGSSGLRIGETDEDDVNNNSMKREKYSY